MFPSIRNSITIPLLRSLLVALLLSAFQASFGEEKTSTEASDRSSTPWAGEAASIHRKIEESLREQVSAMMASMSDRAKAGYRHLTNSVYLPADFDEEVLVKVDEADFRLPLRDLLQSSGGRKATWERFGLSPRPDDSSKPLQYVVTDKGEYVMNCFACHGGNLMGVTYPGAPNTLYALESLTELVRRSKLSLKRPLGHMDVGSMAMPLGTTVGSSNAVMFGVALMNFRDADLNVHVDRMPAAMTNHDMDAPPWWYFSRKSHIYIDGFAEKGHRGLMQFMLVKQNGPQQFQGWEEDFKDVYAFLSELRPPKYPLPIDDSLAARGRGLFQMHCADCHGTYGDASPFPNKVIPTADIGTDPVRSSALTPKHRANYGASWFAHYGKQDTKTEVKGYVAPPLDGIWASAPYFHNGSVPTLWDVLHPDSRPSIWRRIGLGLDGERMGLQVERLDSIPRGLTPPEKRWFFDTSAFGKSNSGHDYPNVLDEDEKQAVLEYLKTL